jgi:hypothetical protein
MTWYFLTTGTKMYVWDHTQDPDMDSPYEELTSQRGWPFYMPFEDIVTNLMEEDILNELESNDGHATPRMMWVFFHAHFQRIERIPNARQQN